MRILLLKNVEGLGSKGSLVEVKNGYAVNFLIPQGWAKLVTQSTLKGLQKFAALEQEKLKRAKEHSSGLLERLKEPLVFPVRSQAGKLFGSVTRSVIAKLLSSRFNIQLAPADILLEGPLKQLGEYTVKVVLPGEVQGELKVLIQEQ